MTSRSARMSWSHTFATPAGTHHVVHSLDVGAVLRSTTGTLLSAQQGAMSFARWSSNGGSTFGRLLAHDILGPPRPPLTSASEADRLAILRRAFESGELRVVVVGLPTAHGVAVPIPPPSPGVVLGPESTVEKTWFEVKVVDVYGKPVDGAEVLFTQGSKKEKAKTDGKGIAKWKDVEGGSFASVAMSQLQQLRDALRQRWGKSEVVAGLEGQKISVLSDAISASLEAEKPSTVILFKPLSRVRLLGMHFDTNKCFLRPTAMAGIRKVVQVYKKLPSGRLLILGHTDTVADDAYNLDLSVERSEAVKAYIKDDAAAWEAWFGEAKPALKRWGKREVGHMLSALPCPQTIVGFQQWSNETRGTSLAADGVAGPRTRRALIEAYMALDGTSLPSSIPVELHGCGEFFPVEGMTADDSAVAENRRVEILCFDGPIVPAVPGPKASKGATQYKQWNAQVTEDVDFAATAPTDLFRVHAVSFKSDHRDPGGAKLLRPGNNLYGEPTDTFEKPEWFATRPACFPISHTVGVKVVVDVTLDCPVSGKLTRLRGVPTKFGDLNMDCFTFLKEEEITLPSDEVTVTNVSALIAIPKGGLGTVGPFNIEWRAVIDGVERPIGSSGPHMAYVTFGTPGGRMRVDEKDTAVPDDGPAQAITEDRLRLALKAFEKVKPSNEDEVVHAMNRLFFDRGVTYSVEFRHDKYPGTTFHQYVWKILDKSARGECDVCAASLILACKMVGVTTPMTVGFMYPLARRDNTDPYSQRPGARRGRVNVPDKRSHAGHGAEELCYQDGFGFFNAFEGVAVYLGKMYAIGESREPYLDAHDFFLETASAPKFGMFWSRVGEAEMATGHCNAPYPGTKVGEIFRWED